MTPRVLGMGGRRPRREALPNGVPGVWCHMQLGDKGCSQDLGSRGGNPGGGKRKWLHLKGWQVSFPTSQ